MSSKTADYSKPFEEMKAWLQEAEKSEPNDPTAVALSSVNSEGMPSIRMVLMRGFDERGAVFYTNFESRKGEDLLATSHAAMLFHWKSLRRQIRLEGEVEVVSDAEADAYFASRPRTSQIGAWASAQSRPMEGRFVFEAAIAKYTAKFGTGPVPRPPHWSGFRLKPKYFEFWFDRKFRLHERICYTLNTAGSWDLSELYP